MWSAIKSDLFEFVSTVQQETTKTISHVIRDKEEHQEGDDRDVTLKALRNSKSTFSEEIAKEDATAFSAFYAKFSLSARAGAIRSLLSVDDDSSCLASHYHDLVPQLLTPEEFWARYFFRADQITGGSSSASLDILDEEEEIAWDNDEVEITTANNAAASTIIAAPATSAAIPAAATDSGADDACANVTPASQDASAEILALHAKIAALEKELRNKQIIIDDLQHKLLLAPTAPSTAKYVSSMSSFATVSHEHDTDCSNSSDKQKQHRRVTVGSDCEEEEEEEGWENTWG